MNVFVEMLLHSLDRAASVLNEPVGRSRQNLSGGGSLKGSALQPAS